jgi:hypothetical protein
MVHIDIPGLDIVYKLLGEPGAFANAQIPGGRW